MGSSASREEPSFEKTLEALRRKFAPDEIQKLFAEVHKYFIDFDQHPFPYNERLKQKAVGQLLGTKTFAILCNQLVEQLRSEADESPSQILECVLLLIAIATENSNQACEDVVNHPELLPTLTMYFNKTILPKISDVGPLKISDTSYSVMCGCLRIIHSVTMYVGNKRLEDEELKEEKGADENDVETADLLKPEQLNSISEILKKCANLEDDVVKLKAISAMACIQTVGGKVELTNYLLYFLLLHLSLALDDTGHQSCGCSAFAMETGLKHYLRARNKETLDLLIQKGVLHILMKGHKLARTEQEVDACLASIWTLSLNKSCFESMARRKLLVDMGKLKKGEKSLQHNLLQSRLQMRDRKIKAGKKGSSDDTPPGHVMLSYQSTDRHTVKRLRDYLEEREIKTWMDIHDMTKKQAKITERMAEAVEGASVVIICVSKAYSESNNCASEANYAHVLKQAENKKIIPLRLEKDYEPRGWLGIITSTEYYYDFTEEENFFENCDKLWGALRQIYAEASGESSAGETQIGEAKNDHPQRPPSTTTLNDHPQNTQSEPPEQDDAAEKNEEGESLKKDDHKYHKTGKRKEDPVKTGDDLDKTGDDLDKTGDDLDKTGDGPYKMETLPKESEIPTTSKSCPADSTNDATNPAPFPSSSQTDDLSQEFQSNSPPGAPPVHLPQKQPSPYQSTPKKEGRGKSSHRGSTPAEKEKLKSRLEEFGIPRKDLDMLSGRDLRDLLKVKSMAPQISHKSVKNDLEENIISEVAKVSRNMGGGKSRGRGKNMTVVHYNY